MKIDYRIRDNSAEIIRCRGTVSKIVLPEQIAGYPGKKKVASLPMHFPQKRGRRIRTYLSMRVRRRFCLKKMKGF